MNPLGQEGADLQVLRLSPGDMLVAFIGKEWHPDTHERFQRLWEMNLESQLGFPVKVIVIPGKQDLEVLRRHRPAREAWRAVCELVRLVCDRASAFFRAGVRSGMPVPFTAIRLRESGERDCPGYSAEVQLEIGGSWHLAGVFPMVKAPVPYETVLPAAAVLRSPVVLPLRPQGGGPMAAVLVLAFSSLLLAGCRHDDHPFDMPKCRSLQQQKLCSYPMWEATHPMLCSLPDCPLAPAPPDGEGPGEKDDACRS